MASEAELLAGRRSLLERAPKDLRMQWQGDAEGGWTVGLSCTVTDRDELDALIQTLTLIGDASYPRAATMGGSDD